eukprot:1752966-Rhodomonas_salina.1
MSRRKARRVSSECCYHVTTAVRIADRKSDDVTKPLELQRNVGLKPQIGMRGTRYLGRVFDRDA